LVGAAFCLVWAVELTQRSKWQLPTPFQAVIGFITDFLDTLGIGSYATTTAFYRGGRVVDDQRIPGTLTVGHTLPTIVQAFIYISIVEVDMTTLWTMIGVSVLGAWLGAFVVTQLPRRGIRLGMGAALLVAAGLLFWKLQFGKPSEVGTTGLDGTLLLIALVGNFILGALMTIGVGAYAPIMIMVSLLGMNPKTAFPIMMGSCAFLMPVASVRFIREQAYDARAALGLSAAGIPAVLIAAKLFEWLPTEVVAWLVLVVVLYTSISMLWAARMKESAPVESSPGATPSEQLRAELIKPSDTV